MIFSAQTFSERYVYLCKQNGISPRKALKEIFCMDVSNLQKWRSGQSIPKADIVFAMAEHFSVSADYLLGRDIAAIPLSIDLLSKDEYDLVLGLRRTTPASAQVAVAAANAVLDALEKR